MPGRTVTLVPAVLTLVLAGGCVRNADEGPTGRAAERPSLQEVLEASSPGWMTIPGVLGTGAGSCDGEACIRVYVSERTPEIDRRIPGSAEGYPVRVEVTGRVRPRG
jgi:hypothetical protein